MLGVICFAGENIPMIAIIFPTTVKTLSLANSLEYTAQLLSSYLAWIKGTDSLKSNFFSKLTGIKRMTLDSNFVH